MASKLRLTRGLLASKPATLLQGEVYFATDTKRIYIGNGDGSDHVTMDNAGGSANPFTAMPYVGTAPIIESGSNANGLYIKYADGTMIQHVRTLVTGVSLSAPTITAFYSWTFPVAFHSTDYVFLAEFRPYQNGTANVFVGTGCEKGLYSESEERTTTAVSYGGYILYASGGTADRLFFGLTAIGRWKA